MNYPVLIDIERPKPTPKELKRFEQIMDGCFIKIKFEDIIPDNFKNESRLNS